MVNFLGSISTSSKASLQEGEGLLRSRFSGQKLFALTGETIS